MNASTRCDREAAERAVVRVKNAKGHELNLCAHHYRKGEAAMKAQGFTVQEDARETLTARETADHA